MTDEIGSLSILRCEGERFPPRNGDVAGGTNAEFHSRPGYLHNLDLNTARENDCFTDSASKN